MSVKPLSDDFESYVLDLTKRNRRMLLLLIAATVAAILAFIVFIFALVAENQMPAVLALVLRQDPGNALNAANLSANLAVGAALRIWYIRQDKMTTLLTHAMVLDGASETAIRVLLNKKIKT